MHIDHSKLVELLTDASGIDKEKVEKQLSDLVEEIQDAISEGDAYEVDGLGVFSGIGDKIMFIPADDFATEINYKYVGMEPIEMEGSAVEEEVTPEQEPEEPEAETEEEEDDPFSGLLDEEKEEEPTGSSFVMDLLNEEDEEEEVQEKPAPEGTGESEDLEHFADQESEESAFDSADEETEDDTTEEVPQKESPGPDKWGIDTYKDAADAGMFSGLLGDSKDEPTEEVEQEEDSESGDDLAAELNKQLTGEDSGDESQSDIDDIFGSDSDNKDEGENGFDDPFEELADEDETEEDNADTPKDDVVPVITNLASESAKKKRQEEEKQTSPEEQETSDQLKQPVTPREAKSQPVLLWVLLIIVVFAAGTYGLGYFGVVHIPGVSPEPSMATSQPAQSAPGQQAEPEETPPAETTTPDQTSQPSDETTSEQPANNNAQPEEPPQEQQSQNQVSQSGDVPAGQALYGLRGVSNPDANDGYTLVVYSLSNENNARAKLSELNDDGYRALLAAIPSQQYEQLWRVSLGQFESLRTAALAAEKLQSPFSENYFITKIK